MLKKRCPFCGERRLIEWWPIVTDTGTGNNTKYVYQCLNCKARGPVTISRTEALDKWNKRKR